MQFMQKVQPIFQNPFEAFNPLKKVDRYSMPRHELGVVKSRKDADAVVDTALKSVGSLYRKFAEDTHELSGASLTLAVPGAHF
jgi:peptide/nickel transport system ATP-binding protein